jgi:Tfp pilus assembly protein PilF
VRAVFGKLSVSFFALLLCVPAAFGQNADTWLSVRSKNFTITGNAAESDLRACAKRLEDFRWAFSQLYPQLKLDNGKATNIVLFKDSAAYAAYLPRRADGTADEGVAGYFQPGEEVNYVTLAASTGQRDPLGTAVHEWTHSVLEANIGLKTIPPWLNEGLADYFKTARVDDGRTIVVGAEIPEHLNTLRHEGLIPLAQLFAVDANGLRALPPNQRRLFYSESWFVVHELMASGRLSLKDLPQTLPKLVVKNGAVTTLLGADISAFEKDLTNTLQQTALKTTTVTSQTTLPAAEMAVEPVSTARTQAILGDLFWHMGDAQQAETLLRKAIASDRNQPLANASLGLLLIRQDKPAEAKPLLRTAIAAGSKNGLVHYNYAYAISRDFTNNGLISSISDDGAKAIHTALDQAIVLTPNHFESYRLLALVDFIRDENLDEAIVAIRRGLELKSDDATLKLLLARILLRRGDAVTARQIAEQVAATGDANSRSDAEEIIKVAYEYAQARSTAAPATELTLDLAAFEGIAILKRSWLTDTDLAQIESERVNNNFNRLVIRAQTGEKQVVGHIERINCTSSDINFVVKTDGGGMTFRSTDFANIRLTVAQEGQSTYAVGCNAKLEKVLAVLNFRPSRSADPNVKGEVTAISFVPDNFRLKTAGEMISARMIAIDDDVARSGSPVTVNQETIRRSILADLRKPKDGEVRVLGKIDTIDCSNGNTNFVIASGGKQMRLSAMPQGRTAVAWFTVASSQISLTCGSGPIAPTAIFTYAPTNNELHSIEFVPDGFPLPQ